MTIETIKKMQIKITVYLEVPDKDDRKSSNLKFQLYLPNSINKKLQRENTSPIEDRDPAKLKINSEETPEIRYSKGEIQQTNHNKRKKNTQNPRNPTTHHQKATETKIFHPKKNQISQNHHQQKLDSTQTLKSCTSNTAPQTTTKPKLNFQEPLQNPTFHPKTKSKSNKLKKPRSKNSLKKKTPQLTKQSSSMVKIYFFLETM